jgi:hypothetical protein
MVKKRVGEKFIFMLINFFTDNLISKMSYFPYCMHLHVQNGSKYEGKSETTCKGCKKFDEIVLFFTLTFTHFHAAEKGRKLSDIKRLTGGGPVEKYF